MTQPPGTVAGPLDTNTLKELARIICGDDHLFYRRSFEIQQFFENAGWRSVPEYDGGSRLEWTLDLLLERREEHSELEKILMRLGDAREYLDEPAQLPRVLEAVNGFLIHEGLRLDNPAGRPRLVACDPALAQPGRHAPAELRATMSDIVREERMATVLQRRLDEAQTCFANGAHVAAIIMLGSLLEGVFLAVIEERDASLLGKRAPHNARLQELIDACHRTGWIDADVTQFSHVLRDYRNFVHPHREMRQDHTPDRDTLNVAWQVVTGALNDLATSRSAPPDNRRDSLLP